MPEPARPRTTAGIGRAISERSPFATRTLHERQRVAFGVTLAAHIRADPALLGRGAATAPRWIDDGGAYVPRSLRDWDVLCAADDVDTVLLALEMMTEYADEMRVSHPLVGILDYAEVVVLRARARHGVDTACSARPVS